MPRSPSAAVKSASLSGRQPSGTHAVGDRVHSSFASAHGSSDEGLGQQIAHLPPGSSVGLGVVAGEVGTAHAIGVFVGETVHDPAVYSDLPVDAALVQHLAESL